MASFYNSRVLEEYDPPISCVNLDTGELAKKASSVLYEILQGRTADRRTILGYEVLLKESTNTFKK